MVDDRGNDKLRLRLVGDSGGVLDLLGQFGRDADGDGYGLLGALAGGFAQILHAS